MLIGQVVRVVGRPPVRRAVRSPVHIRIALLCLFLSCRLKNFLLTGACCEDLAAVIISGSLIELELGIDHLGDSGVQVLCKGLKHPDCKLQRLDVCHLVSPALAVLRFMWPSSIIRSGTTDTQTSFSGLAALCTLHSF
uniref:Uncharacterized protein n=1 Tax=Gopherus agassizii TaxID=38772 RepID=A0A452HK90_9SAUR